ncbi:hypothetical protein CICLE_v10003246mg, partial [Citrus x clementina]
MPKLKLLHIIIIILSCFSSFCQACNQIDQDSLLSLGFNISSPGLNWSSSTDCCLWEGIKCDANGRVSHLWLPWKGLTGTISLSIGNLTHLSHLNLSHNRLSGEFPSSLSSNYIKIIDLSSNHFQGKIPSTIFRLTQNLITFNVSNNSFNYLTGSLPDDIYTATSLEQLSLSFNHISGSIKNGIVNLTSLKFLELYSNSLTGLIPRDIGKLTNLESLVLHNNSLSGSLPSSLKNCYSNLLRSLPDDIYAAASLEEPSLHFNKLSGFISNDIINLTSLLVLELYSKELIGSIPRDIGKLTNLKYLLLYRNNLSGSLPSSMMNCTNLKTLNLMGNLFAGNLSAYNFSVLSQLETIDLYINMFTGSFLLTLTSCRILMGCKNLNVLFLTMNFMNEATPNYDQNKISDGFQNLRAVSLAGCQLTGQVPLWLSKLTKLEVLLLSGNQITGSIPGWFGNLPSLFYFALSQNNISGEFPKELSRLQPLVIEQNKFNRNKPDLPFFLFPNQNSTSHQYNRIFGLRPTIFLANNSLSGRIPAETGQLKFLNVLDLGNNNFAGSIPNQISQLTILERLDLSKNHLSGEIPASLSSLHFLSFFSTAENNLQGPIPSGGQLHTFPPSSFEGNPEFCSDIANRSSTTQPRTTTNIGLPSKSSNNMDLRNGLIAGTVFGFIIGSVTGIVYPLP